jgi:hypothetical protein
MHAIFAWVLKNWKPGTIATFVVLVVWWLSTAWGDVQDDGRRLDVLEATKPDATAALVKQQDEEIHEMHLSVDRTERLAERIAGVLKIQPEQ